MTRIISITNHKGGVGKTTTTASLGVALSMKGKRVLLVDLDAQGNLTSIFTNEEKERGIFEALVMGKDLPVYEVKPDLFLCPASENMINIEKALLLQVGDDKKEIQLLRKLLGKVSAYYDYILIDCPPSLGRLTINALTASNGVIIVLTAESLPMKGLGSLLKAITETRKVLNPGLRLEGILITRYNRRRINRLVEESLRENFGEKVFKTKIRENVDLMEAPLYGKDIFSYAPESLGAMDYTALTDELLNR